MGRCNLDRILMAALSLALGGCDAFSTTTKKSATVESVPTEVEIAVPLTGEQAAMLNGLTGLSAIARVDEAVAGDAVRGEVVAAVRGGVRAAQSSGVRAVPKRQAGDASDLVYQLQTTLPGGLDARSHILEVELSPSGQSTVPLLRVSSAIDLKQGADKLDVAWAVEDVSLPTSNQAGLSNLVQQFAKEKAPGLGLDPAARLGALSDDELKRILNELKASLEQSAKDLSARIQVNQNITIVINIDVDKLNPPLVTDLVCFSDLDESCGQSATIHGSGIKFNFGCNRVDSCAFQCAFGAAGQDEYGYEACRPIVAKTNLQDGLYVLKIQATDAKGVKGPPTTFSFRVALPKQEKGSTGTTTTSDTTATDSGSGATPITDSTGGASTGSLPVPPTVSITGKPEAVGGAAATFSFNCTTDTSGCTFSCSLDNAAFSACSTPKSLAGLADGQHTFSVKALDARGQESSSQSYSWTVDASPPDTTITIKPSNPSGFTTATFEFISTETGSTFECKLDAAAFATCTTPASYPGLSTASHTFTVRAKDSLGNTDSTPETYTWTIDTTQPDTTIASQPSNPSGSTTVSFTFTSNDTSATFECELDAAGFATCTTPKSYSSLLGGSHTFKVRAKSSLGSLDGTPATYAWTIDLAAPTFSGLSTATAAGTSQINLSWTVATDNVSASANIIYRICQSTSSTACTSNFTATYTTAANATSFSATSLTQGTTYYFVTRAVDQASNSDSNTTQKSATTATPPWFSQSSGVTSNLLGVFNRDGTAVFSVGQTGRILKTTDGGTTWTSQSSGTTNDLRSIDCPVDSNTCWAVGISGTVLKTINGGSTWSSQSSGVTNALNSVDFFDNSTGYACGVSGKIIKTSNGGTTWTSLTSNTANELFGIKMPGTDTILGVAVGQAGTILQTADSGTTWSSISSGTTQWLYGLAGKTAALYAVGGSSTAVILKSVNGGSSWTSQTPGTNSILKAVYAATLSSSGDPFAVGNDGVILHGDGTNWQLQTSSTTSTLWSVTAYSGALLYAVGSGGLILKTTTNGW